MGVSGGWRPLAFTPSINARANPEVHCCLPREQQAVRKQDTVSSEFNWISSFLFCISVKYGSDKVKVETLLNLVIFFFVEEIKK